MFPAVASIFFAFELTSLTSMARLAWWHNLWASRLRSRESQEIAEPVPYSALLPKREAGDAAFGVGRDSGFPLLATKPRPVFTHG